MAPAAGEKRLLGWVILAAVVLLVAVLGGDKVLRWGRQTPHTAETILADVFPPEAREKKMPSFQGRVIKVYEGAHVATGFALANSIWLEGPEGVVVVDTTESMEAGRDVYAAMRKIIKAPIRAIIYTHNHGDHCFGTRAFIEDGAQPPDIWAHGSLEWEVENVMITHASFFIRGMRQFGPLIPGLGGGLGYGAGSGLRYKNDNTMGLVMPNRLMEGAEQNVTMAGMSLRLVHIPGETDDQIGVWVPEKKAFLCADDIYKAFPNLYAIRGVPMRNARKWIASLDRMRALRPRYLIPSHGEPIEGEQLIYDVLTSYRDGLQYVHDQTVRFMNRGMYPEDIARKLSLPADLDKKPYLKQLYGTVEWSSRSVFDQYLGWFGGDISQLAAVGTRERAAGMVKLAGGEDKLLAAARDAMEAGDARWALVLSSQLFELNKEHAGALEVRLAALKSLAKQMTSNNGFHYYLTTALEDHKLINNVVSDGTWEDVVQHMAPKQMFVTLRTWFAAERAGSLDQKGVFNFTDIGEVWLAHLRNGIVETTREEPTNWSFKLSTDLKTWRNVMAKKLPVKDAYAQGHIVVEGDVNAFKTFFDLFDNI